MCNACIEVGIAYSRNQIHLVSLRHKVVSYIENIRNWIIAALIIEHCRPSRFVTKSLTRILSYERMTTFVIVVFFQQTFVPRTIKKDFFSSSAPPPMTSMFIVAVTFNRYPLFRQT